MHLIQLRSWQSEQQDHVPSCSANDSYVIHVMWLAASDGKKHPDFSDINMWKKDHASKNKIGKPISHVTGERSQSHN